MPETIRERLLDAILVQVPFDGWSETSFMAACADCEMQPDVARAFLPRGAVDLAAAYHKRGDAAMLARMAAADLTQMRFRDRIALAVRARLEVVEDPELVRRGSALFALPQHAAEGARLIWGT
ncbi:COQ9 family protein, partial [Thioclava sp. BHET1]